MRSLHQKQLLHSKSLLQQLALSNSLLWTRSSSTTLQRHLLRSSHLLQPPRHKVRQLLTSRTVAGSRYRCRVSDRRAPAHTAMCSHQGPHLLWRLHLLP
jgi:hypothetical protein